MESNKKSVFDVLSAIDVSGHVEKKNGLTYLSWAWAWHTLLSRYPTATFEVCKNEAGRPYFDDGNTAWVETSVTVEGVERRDILPIMDNYNRSIPLAKITSFDMNKAIQRSKTKAIAYHGLGLSVYAGEDLPMTQEEPAPTPAPKKAPAKKTAVKKEVSRETWVSMIARNVVNGEGISAYDAYIQRYRPTPGELADLEGEVETYKQEHGIR